MKAGDLIVWVGNIHAPYMTPGKTYTAIDISGTSNVVSVLNDSGAKRTYYQHRFIAIEELREQKLKELGI